jgi:hypothetical protein
VIACKTACAGCLAKHFFNSVRRRQAYRSITAGDTRRITGSLPTSRNLSFEETERPLIGSELRHLRLVASLAARCRVLFGATPCRLGSKGLRSKARAPRQRSHMTIEEVEDVVRALTTVVENLEASSARQSMQEAFTQVRAYARVKRGHSWDSS